MLHIKTINPNYLGLFGAFLSQQYCYIFQVTQTVLHFIKM